MSVLHGSSIGAVEDALELVLDGNSNYINGQEWIAAGGRTGVKVVMRNNPTYTQLGTIGYWRFNGSNQYGYITNLNYGPNSDDGEFPKLTCHVWFRTSANSGSSSISTNWAFIDFDRSEVFNFYPMQNGRLGFSGYAGNTSPTYLDRQSTNANIANNQWRLGTVVWDNSLSTGTLKFYIDGELDSSFNHSGANPLGRPRSRRWGFIGDGSEASSENGGRNNIYYNGDIARIVLLKSAQSASDVKEEYLKHKVRFGL
jgi:hypothetical protein